MPARKVAIDRSTFSYALRAVRSFARSESGPKAGLMLAALIVLLVAVNGLNVFNSYVGRDFMTAIERQDMAEFVTMALLYIAVFAASTAVAVIYRFIEERLALFWRDWLSRGLLHSYLSHANYYRLKELGLITNPDQRIADDVRAFTATTLSFALMLLNGSFTIFAFSGVLWSISPLLFAVAVSYAMLGSVLTILLGRPLVWLNYDQYDKEAAFRAELVHLRDRAESVVLSGREPRLSARVTRRLDDLVANAKRIIAVNRNLGFFTTGYNYLIQIIPALITAPLFIQGKVEFGVITQSALAFQHLLGAFSLIVTQIQSISAYAAVVSRVASLREAVEPRRTGETSIAIVEGGDELRYEHVTVRSLRRGITLIDDLDLTISRGTRALVIGSNDTAKVAFFRATAGIWDAGRGLIIRPQPRQIMFVPERPYMPPGTLREAMSRPGDESKLTDAALAEVLESLTIEHLIARAGGLDVERNLDDILSLREQQLLSLARVVLAAPRFVVLDRITATLGPEDTGRAFTALNRTAVTYISIGNGDALLPRHDAVLELCDDGSWAWRQMPGQT